MIKINQICQLLLLSCLTLAGCKHAPSTAELERILEDIHQELIPDKRIALLDMTIEKKNGSLVIIGETNQEGVEHRIIETLQNKGWNIPVNLKALPDEEGLNGKYFGRVKNSVANLRSMPKHSSELATQALMGHPLKVLKQEGEWYLVQTTDKYISWIDQGGLTLNSKKEYSKFLNGEKIIYLRPFGNVYSQNNSDESVSDITFGGILEKTGQNDEFYHVLLPNGELGELKKGESRLYKEWLNSENPEITENSLSYLGYPYLWGGTSSKGVDCSGFTKMIYFAQKKTLPRDASQQVTDGTLIDDNGNFEKLVPGDLLFFGSKRGFGQPDKVVHVGMWLGDSKYIHSSGNVHISSMDSTQDQFDEFNWSRYLKSKRYDLLNSEMSIDLRKQDLFSNLYPTENF